MDNSTNTPVPINRDEQGKSLTLKILGVEIPLPPWAVSIVAAVGIIAFAVTLVFTVMHYGNKSIDPEAQVRIGQPPQPPVTVKGEPSKDGTGAEFEEAVRHQIMNERSEDKKFTKPNLTVRLFKSDGCVWVIRETQSGNITKWFPDPSKVLPPPTRKPEVSMNGPSIVPGLATVSLEVAESLAQPVAFDPPPTHHKGEIALAQPNACNRRCQNPHPGAFRSWWGERKGCWYQAWRQWPDGCVHYQWFNTCYSYWDADERGQPRVYWTCCTH